MPPCCIAEKLARPRSSSAQTSPSRTACGVFTAFASSFATFGEALRQVVVLAREQRHLAAADVGERAVAVPLHLERASRSPRGTVALERREHRPVPAAARRRLARRPRACARSASSAPCRRGAPERAPTRPSSRSPCSRTVRPPFRFSSSELVRARRPRSRPCRRRTAPCGISPSNFAYSIGWSSTWTARCCSPGLERHALRHGPATRARRRARAGSRSGAAARRAAGRRRSAPSPRRRAPRRTAPASAVGSRLRRYCRRLTCGELARGACLGIGSRDENMICKRPGFAEEAFPQAGGPTLEAGFYRPRVVFRAGEKAVDTGESCRGKPFASSEDAERAESRAPPAPELVARNRRRGRRAPPGSPRRAAAPPRPWSVWAPPAGSGTIASIDAELEAVRGVGLERGGGLLASGRRRARGSRRSPRARSRSRSRSPA